MKFSLHFTFAIMLMCVSLFAPHTAFAQSNADDPSAKVPKITVLPPAYEKQMMRLSEVLGALHYLRELCGANEGQLWRNEMQNLITQEEPTEQRKAQMIARFNRGFRGFQESYRECTDAAIEANNRYVLEGTKLAGEIPTRFGR